jgi:hypothetical protein
MDRMQATPRSPFLGGLADLLMSSYSPERTQQMQGLMNFMSVPAVARTVDRLSYGEPLTTGAGMTTALRPDTKETTAALLGLLPIGRAVEPAAVATGRALEPVAGRVAEAAYNRGGLAREMAMAMGQGTQSQVYLPSTPLKPNPLVGTRFEREFQGGLADKTPVDVESLRGSSLLIMPWDSTNRNMLVKSISDVELPSPVLTTGGQDFARDIRHIEQNIGGASNFDIAKRILDRADVARQENLSRGGTGDVYMLPSTMGQYGENFSTMPADILLGLADVGKLKKAEIKAIDQSIRSAKIPKMITVDGRKQRVNTTPFKSFKGIMTEEGRSQLRTGEGLETSAGELRKALANRMYLKSVQERLGFNEEDLIASITDPALTGVPKGYVGNTIIQAADQGLMLPSTHPAYDTDFSGRYVGSLMQNIPVEVAMPKTFAAKSARHAGKKADLRTMTIGDLEKSKEGVSEFVDDQTINSLMEYMLRNHPR